MDTTTTRETWAVVFPDGKYLGRYSLAEALTRVPQVLAHTFNHEDEAAILADEYEGGRAVKLA